MNYIFKCFGYLNYDTVFSKKGWYFQDYNLFLLSSDYDTFNQFSVAKTDFGLATTILKHHD
jgi:NTE family protein